MKRRTLLLCITALASYAAEMRIPDTTVYDQEGQRSGGRRITRESLVGALERLHNFFTELLRLRASGATVASEAQARSS